MQEILAVFRVDPDGSGFVLFPTLAYDRYGHRCDCWQPVGQHCGADYNGCIAASRPASAELTASLKAEYEGCYNGLPDIPAFTLKVAQRVTHHVHEARRAEASRLANVR